MEGVMYEDGLGNLRDRDSERPSGCLCQDAQDVTWGS